MWSLSWQITSNRYDYFEKIAGDVQMTEEDSDGAEEMNMKPTCDV